MWYFKDKVVVVTGDAQGIGRCIVDEFEKAGLIGKMGTISIASRTLQLGNTSNLIYTSGQIPINPATGSFIEGGIKEQARQSLLNVKAILEEAGLTMGNVVKTTVFMADMNDFADMNAVYAEFFTEPYPARSAVAVKTLPKGALVEIEVVAGLLLSLNSGHSIALPRTVCHQRKHFQQSFPTECKCGVPGRM